MKVIVEDKTIKELNRGKRRAQRKEAGLMDGRFKTKVVEDKSKYSRKEKHRKNL